MSRKTVDAYGLTMLDEAGCYPGGASLSIRSNYDKEKLLFDECLDNVEGSSPVMIELGSYWALWSLLFRKRYPSGTNILIELFEENLSIGIENFKLNDFTDRIISVWLLIIFIS